jgi:hypothetical protein
MTQTSPLRFRPEFEHPEPDEAATDAQLDAQLAKVREITFAHSGHPTRSVHAKAHGLLRGRFTVNADLPSVLAQGLFAAPGSFDAVLRFSTIPGDVLDDSVSTPRGVALKLIGVEGERLPGSAGERTQDFLMVNAPAFAAPTAKKFLGNLKLAAATTDRFEGAKILLSHVARTAEAVVEAFGGKSALIVTLGGQKSVHILGETFYSQTPFLYGDYIAKFSLVPASPDLLALGAAKFDVDDGKDALREGVRSYFATHAGAWDFKVQLCADLDAMPIEDASVVWPEQRSPYLTVGRLDVPAQDSWSAENQAAIDDGMAFSPWDGLAAHRPLGSINRARRDTYAHSARFRSDKQGQGAALHPLGAAPPDPHS